MNIQHSSRHDFWQTPPDILELVRAVLGPIGLDPASSDEANMGVRAEAYITKEQDALSCAWPGPCSVYLNPPGGKRGGKSNVRLFWNALMVYRQTGMLTHGIFAAFSIEALQTTQGDFPCIMDFPICVPKSRVRWVHPHEVKLSPSHSNVFVYVPGTFDRTREFLSLFSVLGAVKE